METVGGDAVEKLLDEASYSMLEHVVYKVKPVLELGSGLSCQCRLSNYCSASYSFHA